MNNRRRQPMYGIMLITFLLSLAVAKTARATPLWLCYEAPPTTSATSPAAKLSWAQRASCWLAGSGAIAPSRHGMTRLSLGDSLLNSGFYHLSASVTRAAHVIDDDLLADLVQRKGLRGVGFVANRPAGQRERRTRDASFLDLRLAGFSGLWPFGRRGNEITTPAFLMGPPAPYEDIGPQLSEFGRITDLRLPRTGLAGGRWGNIAGTAIGAQSGGSSEWPETNGGEGEYEDEYENEVPVEVAAPAPLALIGLGLALMAGFVRRGRRV